LLADAREQASAVVGSIEATRDFWIAEANLETALLAGSPRAGASEARPTNAASPPTGGAH